MHQHISGAKRRFDIRPLDTLVFSLPHTGPSSASEPMPINAGVLYQSPFPASQAYPRECNSRSQRNQDRERASDHGHRCRGSRTMLADTAHVRCSKAKSTHLAVRFGLASYVGIPASPTATRLTGPQRRRAKILHAAALCRELPLRLLGNASATVFRRHSPYSELTDGAQSPVRIKRPMQRWATSPSRPPVRHVEVSSMSCAPGPHRMRASASAGSTDGALSRRWSGNQLPIRIRLGDVAVVRARAPVMSLAGSKLKTRRNDGERTLFLGRRCGNPVAMLALTFAAGPSVPRSLGWPEREYALADGPDLRRASQPMALSVPQRAPDVHA